MKRSVSCMFFVLWCSVVAGAAETGPAPAAKNQAISESARQYEEAFNKGDAKAMAALFTEDVEYTDEDGMLTTGREALVDLLRRNLARNAGAKLAIQVDSVKSLSPEVLVERGTSAMTSREGIQSSSAYRAIHVLKNGKWLISEIVETAIPAPSPGDGGNFLTRRFTVTSGGEVTLEGWQIIGWDPGRRASGRRGTAGCRGSR